jgi:hypothetical protein
MINKPAELFSPGWVTAIIHLLRPMHCQWQIINVIHKPNDLA